MSSLCARGGQRKVQGQPQKALGLRESTARSATRPGITMEDQKKRPDPKGVQLPGAVQKRKSKPRTEGDTSQSDLEETSGKSLPGISRDQEEETCSGVRVIIKKAKAQDQAKPILRPPGGVEDKGSRPLRFQESPEESGGTATKLNGVTGRKKSKNRSRSRARQKKAKEINKKGQVDSSEDQEEEDEKEEEEKENSPHPSPGQAKAQDQAKPILRPPGSVEDKGSRPLRFQESPEGSGGTATKLNGVTGRKKSKSRSRSRAARQKKAKEINKKGQENSSEDQEEEEEKEEEEKENSSHSSPGQAEAEDRARSILRLRGGMEDQQRLGRQMGKLRITEEREKSKSRSRSRDSKDTDGRHPPENVGDHEEEQEVEEEKEEEEEKEGAEEKSLLASVNMALKTVVRNVFEKLYLKLFNNIHPGKTPFEVLEQIPRGRMEMNKNRTLREILQKNQVGEFDITASFLILRNACGLSSEDDHWKDTSKIEGNIQMLKDIRNEDGHWTPKGEKSSSKERWLLIHRHVVLLIHLSGLSDQFPDVERDLDRIKSDMQYKGIPSHRRSIQEGILRELKEAFTSQNNTSLMPLVWAGTNFRYKFSVLETYTNTQLEIHHANHCLLPADAQSLLDKVDSCKRILVEGESGTGKTSLLRYYASLWASSSGSASFLKDFKYLLLLDCKAFSNKTASLSDVILQILPQACNKWKQKYILKELSLAGDQVFILIDALDERTDAFKSVFETIQNRCPEATFVVTMRPHCTKTIQNLCNKPQAVVTSKGFTYSSSLEYAEKVFQTLGRQEDPKEFLKQIAEFEELVKIPQLLVWTAWFYLEEEINFSSRGEVFDKLSRFMLRKMCFIHGKRVMAKEIPPNGKKWLDSVAKIAFQMCKEDATSIDHSSPEYKELEKVADKLELRPCEALSTLMQCNSRMTSEGEQISFQFLLESHADYLVAYHIASTDKLKELKKFTNDRLTNIVKCVTWLLFKDGGSPSKENMKHLISLCIKDIYFYDLRLPLSLITESNYNQNFLKIICSYPPDSPLVAQQDSPKSTTKRPGCRPAVLPFKNIDKNICLWITGKELKHTKALECLLRELKPSKIWLRLCEGIRETEDGPSQNFTELEAGSALAMLKRVYGKTPLAELRISDTTLEGKLEFPEFLWWLQLERCTIKKNIRFPDTLLKLSFLECSGTGEVGIPKSLQSLKMISCKGYRRIGGPNDTLRMIELEDCDLEMLGSLGPSLERIRISSCRIREPLVLPRQLKHLHIEDMSSTIQQIPGNLQTLEITLTTADKIKEVIQSGPASLDNLAEIQWNYIEELESVLSHNLSIKTFTLLAIFQPPEDLLSLALNIREKLPRASVLLQSFIPVAKNPLCDYIHEVVSTTPLPELCIKFGDKDFSNMVG